MRQLSDQAPHGLARQPRIGVERNDIADTRRHGGRLPVAADKGRISGAAQQTIQLMQLAALTFPSHPLPLSLAPDPAAVKHIKALAPRKGSMHAIQPCDALVSQLEQRIVARDAFGRSIAPVREQREMDFAVRRSEEMHFKTLDLLLQR